MVQLESKDIQVNLQQNECVNKQILNTSIENLSKINELKSIIIKNKLSNYIKTEPDQSSQISSPEKTNKYSIKYRRNSSIIQQKNGRLLSESSRYNQKIQTKNKSLLSSPTSPQMKNKRNFQSRTNQNQVQEELNASFIVIQKGIQQPRVRTSLPSCLSSYQKQNKQNQQTHESIKTDQQASESINSNQQGMRIRKIVVSQKKMNQPFQRNLERDSEMSSTYRSLSRCQSKSQGVVYQNQSVFPSIQNKKDINLQLISQTMDCQLQSNALCQQLASQPKNKIILTCPDARVRNKNNLYYHQQVREQISQQNPFAQLDSQKKIKTENQYLDSSKSEGEQNSFSCLETCYDITQTTTTTATTKLQNNSSIQQFQAPDQLTKNKKIIEDCNLIQKQEENNQIHEIECNINSEYQALNQNRYLPKMYKYQSIKLKQSIKNNQKILETPPKIDRLAQKMKVLSVYNYNKAIRTSYSPDSIQDISNFYQEAKSIISRQNYSNLIQGDKNSFTIKVTAPSLQQNQDENI
ncbi:hypothetical protein TTHERM_00294890 (macronuclear) [Tetrahymena thermophila SB210]|uniref:Uncharacterized protein n=1 Tax=Tetrahymena thermophila (strain SB210) TaxID=312017 RepID=I7M0X2_TETTS|nr:hypothetical protein TTHERM_00294890 [Tetrahymena thermophila SB210]EAR92876.2 hypothetical protein TTHERM_00294890 [Tetrahymena thermophila SB210]|eukprot:XP_001013121.2 hypothetical protein TTHERM_00294890 [Tetrahymena thermophila SB210]